MTTDQSPPPASPLPEGRADGQPRRAEALIAAVECEHHIDTLREIARTATERADKLSELRAPAAPVVAVPGNEAGEVVHALMMQGGERLPLCGEPQPVHRWAGLTTNPNEVTCSACLGVPEAGEGRIRARHPEQVLQGPALSVRERMGAAPVVGEREEKP